MHYTQGDQGGISNINCTETRSSFNYSFFINHSNSLYTLLLHNKRSAPFRCEGKSTMKLGSHSLVVYLQPTLTWVLHSKDFLYLKIFECLQIICLMLIFAYFFQIFQRIVSDENQPYRLQEIRGSCTVRMQPGKPRPPFPWFFPPWIHLESNLNFFW